MVAQLSQFSAEERERIRRALEDARNATSAKFEFAVVPASDHYELYPIIWGALAALTLTGGLALLRPSLGIGAGFMVNAALFIAFSLLLEWRPLRLRIVPRNAKRAATTRMAHSQFAVSVLLDDDAHNGVMLFASLAERHLEIIAERDAHSQVPAGTWDRIVADATSLMRTRGVADGFVAAIEACGKVLAAAFPKKG